MVVIKLHRLGYTESYAERQSYNYGFLNNRNGVGIYDASFYLDTIAEETYEQIDVEVDVEIEGLSVATPYESEKEAAHQMNAIEGADDYVISATLSLLETT